MKFILVMGLFCLAACQKQFSPDMQRRIEQSVKRSEISGQLTRLFRGVDEKNWSEVLDVLAPEVELDMGGGLKKMKAEEVVEIWKKASAGLDGSHHNFSNSRTNIEGRTAEMICYGDATHYKKLKSGRNFRRYFGTYEIAWMQPELEGEPDTWQWKVTKFIYKNKFIEGNAALR